MRTSLDRDRDQLYFDRVHNVAPIIQKQRYFAWADQGNPSPARACLRSAMRTVASAVSAQFWSLSDALYAETRRMLEALDGGENGHGLPWVTDKAALGSTIKLEQIQAWLLLVHFEILRMPNHISLTAGRAFRLVQLSRLYDIDANDLSPAPEFAGCLPLAPLPSVTDKSFAEAEEMRRTFWLAFIFDRFLSTRDNCPLTLHEELVSCGRCLCALPSVSRPLGLAKYLKKKFWRTSPPN